MVPAAYHEFFSTVAEVAGTLIGLLFVAVSLSPEKLNGDDIDFQVRAGVAFVALTNGLVLALAALLPSADITTAGYIVSVGGISTCLGFVVIGLRLGERRRIVLRVLLRVGVLLALFVIELVYVIDLQLHPHRSSAVETLGVLTIAGFAFAIQRAWELVGGSGATLVPTLARMVAGRVAPPLVPEGTRDAPRPEAGVSSLPSLLPAPPPAPPEVTPERPGDHRPG